MVHALEIVRNSAYNSLQVSLKHGGGGLTIMGSYTYGKSLDQASNLGEPVDPYNYGLTRVSSFDIGQDFVTSYRYELPFDKLFKQSDEGMGCLRDHAFQQRSSRDADQPQRHSLGRKLQQRSEWRLYSNRADRFVGLPLSFRLPGATFPRSVRPATHRDGCFADRDFSESKVLEFRMETFNTFNHAQFFGANSVDGNINDATFGQVVNAMSPRLMQAALKFRF
jgi:hypothetical protein